MCRGELYRNCWEYLVLNWREKKVLKGKSKHLQSLNKLKSDLFKLEENPWIMILVDTLSVVLDMTFSCNKNEHFNQDKIIFQNKVLFDKLSYRLERLAFLKFVVYC